MSDKSIILSQSEQNVLTEVLFNAKKETIKHDQAYTELDSILDKVASRVTLEKREKPHVEMFDGVKYNRIYKAGKFESEHGVFSVQEVHEDNTHIKVNGNWHHKGEFEPAAILSLITKGLTL